MIYGYLRVSTDTQDERNQKMGVLSFSERMNLPIDEWIVDDGVSGTKEPSKRKLGPLMQKMKPGDTIIASEISRLGRELYMIMRILEFFGKNGIKCYTVKDNFRLDDDIQSKVLAFAFGLSAEIERRLISQRTKEALARKKAEGIKLGRPYGCKNKRTKLTGKEDIINGMLQDGISKTKIARMMNVHRVTILNYSKTKI